MARTIDNLGIDISTQYAEGREAYDDSFKDSPTVSSQARIDVTTPFLPSEFDTLFGLCKRMAPWPAITAPPQFSALRRPLFHEQMIPSMGTLEAQEAQIERLEAFGNEVISRQTAPSIATEIGQEKAALSRLLKQIHTLDQDLIEINARRVQYQKG